MSERHKRGKKQVPEDSTHAIITGDRVTFYPSRITLDCTLKLELSIYDSVLKRLSGTKTPDLEKCPTERAIYQNNRGIVYSFCKKMDKEL